MNIFLNLLIIFEVAWFCHGQQTCEPINGYEGCACQISGTNKTMGLDALVANDTQKRMPRFQTTDDKNWMYGFHPCRNFDMFTNITGSKACKAATAVRYTDKGATKVCNNLGATGSGKFAYVKNAMFNNFTGLTITYRDMASSNKGGAMVYLKCNDALSLEESKFSFLNVTEGEQETYYFQLESRCCCPGLCPVEPKPSSGVMDKPIMGRFSCSVAAAYDPVFAYACINRIVARSLKDRSTRREDEYNYGLQREKVAILRCWRQNSAFDGYGCIKRMMDIGASNITEYYLQQKATIMDSQIGAMSAERTTSKQQHRTQKSSTALRHLDPDTDFKVRRIASRVNEALQLGANEPALGLYRIQEHVYRTLPSLVERKTTMKENHKKIEDAVYDLNLSMNVIENLSKIKNFTRIQAALHTAIEMKRNLNILHEQEKARVELDATNARRANKSISINEPAEGYICPVCYFAHTNQDELILHWQREHSLSNYENDVFDEIELPEGHAESHNEFTQSTSTEYSIKHDQDTTIIDIPRKERYVSECEDVVRSLGNDLNDDTTGHSSNLPGSIVQEIDFKSTDVRISETNESSASSASSEGILEK